MALSLALMGAISPRYGVNGTYGGSSIGAGVTATLDTLNYDAEADTFEWTLSGTLSEARPVQYYARFHTPISGWTTSNLWAGWTMIEDYGASSTTLSATTTYSDMSIAEIRATDVDSVQMMAMVQYGPIFRSAWSAIPADPNRAILSNLTSGLAKCDTLVRFSYGFAWSCSTPCATIFSQYRVRFACVGATSWASTSDWINATMGTPISTSIFVTNNDCDVTMAECPVYMMQVQAKVYASFTPLVEVSSAWKYVPNITLSE